MRLMVRFFFLTTVLISAAAHGADFSGLPVIGGMPSEGDGKFSFAILGDKTSGGEGKWPIYDEAVDAINLLEPDFVITVGDQIPGHMQERALWDAEWAEYLAHAERLEKPLIMIPGNHDIANVECYAFWKEDFGKTYFSFDYRDCHFLVFNTEEERIDGRGPVWQAMMDFMEADLAANTDARHTFVFFHKPMWDDPRYEETWARMKGALGERPCTIVAGHEHYHATERDGNMMRVLQSATGGGIDLSEVKEFGAFHSFGYVTVDGDDVRYAVIEVHPGGGVYPVDVAPASFRKAIANDVFTMDALPGGDYTAAAAEVHVTARFVNPFDTPIVLEATLEHLDAGDWSVDGVKDGALVMTEELAAGEEVARQLVFTVPQAGLAVPPRAKVRVKYEGHWLGNESFPMVQEDVVPIHPVASLRVVPEWMLLGPIGIGDIDTKPLPADPAKGNANFFKAYGGEAGYDPDGIYPEGREWFKAASQGRGLLNFNALMGTLDHTLGYAACAVYSPRAQRTHALVYSDNFHQGVLNGELIDTGRDFGAPTGFTWIPLDLEAGWNTFVVKLFNNHGDWFLRVLLADPENNLAFAPSTPE